MTFELTDAAPPASAACPVPPTAAKLSQARRATRTHFAVLGVVGGAWGVHIPSVKTAYDLGPAALSGVLLAAATGAVLSLLVAGRVIGRLGARRTTVLAMTLIGLMLAAALWWPSMPAMLPSMLLFGASLSLFDVAINTEGTALETLAGRKIMSNLHGMFSVGAMAGAAVAGAMLNAGIAATTQLFLIGGLAALVSGLASRHMLDAHPLPEGGEQHARFVWPKGLLLAIGLLVFAGMSAEGVMYDWCVLYLKQEVGLSQDRAAIGYAAFAGAMAVMRFLADPLRARYDEGRLLQVGAAVCALSMAILLVSGHAAVSIVGYALIGAGLAPVVPILFAAAARVPGTDRAAAIAAVSSIGYAGFMIGPPLIGGIAQAVSLTAAMFVVVVAAAALFVGARVAMPRLAH